MKQKVIIIGSSGSIGLQTLEVIRLFPKSFEVVGLSVYSSKECLIKQVQEFSVPNISIFCKKDANEVQLRFSRVRVFSGNNGIEEMIKTVSADVVILALVGEVGLGPAKKTLETKKHLALATKEVMVVAGKEIMKLAQKNNVDVRPIDSEHSAIWQCLHSGTKKEIRKIWLTCSGGPFFDKETWNHEVLKKVTPQEALKHPNWDMGKKISIDSATLMNKALELIEAVQLFQVPPEKIEVVIHPESILHSAIEFVDGSIIGQMGTADMRIPIAHALFYPKHCPLPFPKFSFFNTSFHFYPVDEDRFPSIQMARKALGKNKCKEFNFANEKAVDDFLNKKIGFLDIFSRVQKALI